VHIFIDESGVFVVPSDERVSVSVVAAVVVPNSNVGALKRDVARLSGGWGIADGEIKGRELTESRFAAILDVLFAHDVFAVIGAVDLGGHTEAEVTEHRRLQAARITANLNASRDPALRSQVGELVRRVEALPGQLYVQMFLLTRVISSVVRLATVLHPDAPPMDLDRFAWRLDAKDRSRTEYENLWKTLVAPFAESLSRDPDSPFSRLDAKRVLLEDLSFANSRTDVGLQIADVVANCFRRACCGRLKSAGWSGLGRLLMKDPRLGHAIVFCELGATAGGRAGSEAYADVVRTLEREARSFVARRASS